MSKQREHYLSKKNQFLFYVYLNKASEKKFDSVCNVHFESKPSVAKLKEKWIFQWKKKNELLVDKGTHLSGSYAKVISFITVFKAKCSSLSLWNVFKVWQWAEKST